MACACLWSVTPTNPRESPGSGDGLSPGWRQAWACRESSHGHQGTCSETPGRYRDITSLRRRQRPRPARLRAHPAVGARPAIRDRACGLTRRQAGGGNRRLGLALLVIATAQLMVVLDATIVNVALPHVQRALGFSGTGLEWVVNAYAVTFGGLLLLGGRAGDILGRRRVFVFGLLLFSAASLLGGFATSQWWLLTARAVQGVGGAVIAPTALALITTNFPEGEERNRAFGVYAAMAGAGSAVGLLLGGHPDHLRVVAVGDVRQRPDRDRGGGRGAARAGRIAPPAGPDRRGRRGHRHRRHRAARLRPVQGRHRG